MLITNLVQIHRNQNNCVYGLPKYLIKKTPISTNHNLFVPEMLTTSFVFLELGLFFPRAFQKSPLNEVFQNALLLPDLLMTI